MLTCDRELTQASIPQDLETQVLLWCIRLSTDPAIDHPLPTLIAPPLNWTTLLQLAERHRAMPLLYRSLKAACPDAIPPEMLTQMRRAFSTTGLYNQWLAQELLHVLQLFQQQDIEVVTFKGAILAADVYGDLALRQFGDLDLLVRPQDLRRAQTLLHDRGYQLQMNLDWEYHFFHPVQRINIDLHQALTPAFFRLALDFESLRSRFQPITLLGESVAHFSPEDLLLILATQVGKDCCHWNLRLMQLSDIAHLIAKYPALNWQQVWQRAQDLGIERLLCLSLNLTHHLLAISLPPETQVRLQTHQSESLDGLTHQLIARLWEPLPPEPEDLSFWSFFWLYDHRLYWQLRERSMDRLIYLLVWLRQCVQAIVLPNQGDRDLLSLPHWLHGLYYPFHILRLLYKRGLNPLRQRLK